MTDPSRLMEAYVADELTEAQAAELAEWLRADPAHAEAFVRLTHVDTALGELLKEGTAARDADEEPGPIDKTYGKPGARRAWRWLAAAAVLVAIAGGWWLAFGPGIRPARDPAPRTAGRTVAPDAAVPAAGQPFAFLTVIEGDVSVVRNGSSTPARGRQFLYANDALVATATGLAEVHYEDAAPAGWAEPGAGSTLTVLPNTRVRLDVRDGGKHVRLDGGALLADIAPQPSEAPMRVETELATLTVLGTEFTVAAEPDRTRVDTFTGLVRVEHRITQSSASAAAGGFVEASRSILGGSGLAKGRTAPKVSALSLVRADTGEPVPGCSPLEDGAVLDSRVCSNVLIRAHTQPPRATRVLFDIRGVVRLAPREPAPLYIEIFGKRVFGRTTRGVEDRSAGFAFSTSHFGDEVCPWQPAPGRYTIVATPCAAGSLARTRSGAPLRVSVEVARSR